MQREAYREEDVKSRTEWEFPGVKIFMNSFCPEVCFCIEIVLKTNSSKILKFYFSEIYNNITVQNIRKWKVVMQGVWKNARAE